MRITCDACAAKYSISDDKLSGKAFKIRCKKCSHVMLVRAPEVVEVWHLVVNDEQVGPLTAEDVRARCERGEITRATYGWREGMEAWLALESIDELAALFEPAALPAVHVETPPEETPAEAPRLLAERNESSVLFSMTNLARLAAVRPAPAAAPGEAAPLQEGSGLIDIRSMASAYRGAGTAAPARSTIGSIGSIDDLPVFATSSFAEPAVIVPAPARTPPRFVGALIAAIVVLAAIAIALIVIVVKRDPQPPVVAQIVPVPVFAPAASTPAVATAPVEVPSGAAGSATPVAAQVSGSAVGVGPHERVAQPRGHTPPHVEVPHPPPPPPSLPPINRTDDCDEVKCIVNGDLPCCHARAPKSDSSLPERLGPKMIAPALEPVKARVLACGNATTGRIRVHIHVGSDGKVTAATLEQTAAPALEACVAAAVKRAAFPKTQNGGAFVVSYAF